jgi:hypothetical protein
MLESLLERHSPARNAIDALRQNNAFARELRGFPQVDCAWHKIVDRDSQARSRSVPEGGVMSSELGSSKTKKVGHDH